MKKKLLTIVLCSVCTCSMLAGCGKTDTPTTASEVKNDEEITAEVVSDENVTETDTAEISDTETVDTDAETDTDIADVQEYELPRTGIVIKYDSNETVTNLDEVLSAISEKMSVEIPAEYPADCPSQAPGVPYRTDLADTSVVADDDPNLIDTGDLTNFNNLRSNVLYVAYQKYILAIMYNYCDEKGIDKATCDFVIDGIGGYVTTDNGNRTILHISEMTSWNGIKYLYCNEDGEYSDNESWSFITALPDIWDWSN